MIPMLILASNSPRRRQLLALTGWTFSVQPVDIDENPHPGELPPDYVLRLAETKALAAGKQALPGQVVLAADTTVADENRILGKPESAAEARDMLRSLRGRAHTVYTALGVLRIPGASGTPRGSEASYRGTTSIPINEELPSLITDVCATRVWMRSYTDEEIDAYIASGDPFDKAGAYAIQNTDFQPVERIEGCYACVVGLPVCYAVRMLARFGLTPPEAVTAACAAHLAMDTPCPVYEALLKIESGGSQNRGNDK